MRYNQTVSISCCLMCRLFDFFFNRWSPKKNDIRGRSQLRSQGHPRRMDRNEVGPQRLRIKMAGLAARVNRARAPLPIPRYCLRHFRICVTPWWYVLKLTVVHFTQRPAIGALTQRWLRWAPIKTTTAVAKTKFGQASCFIQFLKAGLHVRRKHKHEHKPRVNRFRKHKRQHKKNRSAFLFLVLRRPGSHVAYARARAYACACVLRGVNQPEKEQNVDSHVLL